MERLSELPGSERERVLSLPNLRAAAEQVYNLGLAKQFTNTATFTIEGVYLRGSPLPPVFVLRSSSGKEYRFDPVSTEYPPYIANMVNQNENLIGRKITLNISYGKPWYPSLFITSISD
ncbi:MAG: hypothetical protein QW046_04545 [Candidatus Micrarchaeaceae archaeon]